jgi:DMSO/TMAO reductase YedYZ molybdopterin-dependent catalytic subunit
VAVGGLIIDHVPEALKSFAISIFGTYDKVALITGTLVVLALIAAALGVLAIRRVAIAYAGIAVFGLVGAVAAATRHDAAPTAVLPSVIGAAAAIGFVWAVLRPAALTGYDRRRFLRVAGGTLAAAVVAGVAGRWLASRRGVSVERAAVTLPAPASPAPALPAAAELGVPGLAPFVTSNADFYRIDTAIVVPQVSPDTWRLRVHGRVRNPMTITYAQLLARPMIERYTTLTCVSNEVGGELVGNARWLGVPLKDLLMEAGPEDGADQVVSRSVDGFTAGTPTAALLDGRDAMLAIAMNGEPLPVQHGFPVRMVVPGLYGYVSATKWLAELELTTFADYDAYWVPRGWAQQAPIKTGSRIDAPRPSSDPRAGSVVVAGVAWAQHRGISKVEVRVDNGPWNEATLSAVPSIDTWRQWRWTWPATSGEHRLTVRASDNAGEVQTDKNASPAPDGASGLHTVVVTVR